MLALKDILVPTDFGECSNAALAYGRALAHHFGARLHVLNVVDVDGFDVVGTDASFSEILETAEQSARERLEALVAPDDRATLRAVAAVRLVPRPAEAIVAFAAECHVDLIVMGTHGRTGRQHLLMGSVAERVVRMASCPVLTVHASRTGPVVPEAPGTPATTGQKPALHD